MKKLCELSIIEMDGFHALAMGIHNAENCPNCGAAYVLLRHGVAHAVLGGAPDIDDEYYLRFADSANWDRLGSFANVNDALRESFALLGFKVSPDHSFIL